MFIITPSSYHPFIFRSNITIIALVHTLDQNDWSTEHLLYVPWHTIDFHSWNHELILARLLLNTLDHQMAVSLCKINDWVKLDVNIVGSQVRYSEVKRSLMTSKILGSIPVCKVVDNEVPL